MLAPACLRSLSVMNGAVRRESSVLEHRWRFFGGMPLLPDPRPRSRVRLNKLADGRSGRSQPFTDRVRAGDSGFWLL